MKNNKVAEIVSLIFVAAEFAAFLIWGLNIQAGDEMGYGLIVIYAIMPLTALILSAVLTAKNSVFLIPVVLLKILSHIFLPFLIYGTFEIGLSLVLSAVPCVIGLTIGSIINTIKSK